MRALVRRFDRMLCRLYGIFEFTEDPECVLRLRLTRASHALTLDASRIARGEPVIELHLWNDHLPPLPAEGADLAYGRRIARLWLRSLHAAARYIQAHPRLSAARAVGGSTGILSSNEHTGGMRMLERLGFTVRPAPASLGRFGRFWENLYAAALLWAYNPASLRGRGLCKMERLELWMTMDAFLERFGEGDHDTRTGEASYPQRG